MPLEAVGLFSRIAKALKTENVEEISRKVLLSKQAVYLWQKGKPPSLETLLLISDLSGTSLHWLVTGEGPELIDGSTGLEQVRAMTPFAGGVRLAALEDLENNFISDDDLYELTRAIGRAKGEAQYSLKRILARTLAHNLLTGLDISGHALPIKEGKESAADQAQGEPFTKRQRLNSKWTADRIDGYSSVVDAVADILRAEGLEMPADLECDFEKWPEMSRREKLEATKQVLALARRALNKE